MSNNPLSIQDQIAIVVEEQTKLHNMLVRALMQTKEKGGTASMFAKLFDVARQGSDAVTEGADKIKGISDELKTKHIPEAFEREETSSLTLEDGTRITVSQKVVASIPAAQKEAAFKWLTENGHGSLIQPTVNASTLASFWKAEMAEARMPPEDDHGNPIFNVHVMAQASRTAGKKKA